MKKQTLSLVLTSLFLVCNISQAQTVRIGNMATGVTASGNTLSLNNGANAIQIAGVPPLLQGAISATQDAVNPTNNSNAQNNSQKENASGSSVDINKINAENLAKVEAAKNNFIKQNEENIAKMNESQQSQNVNTIEQKEVRVGQDLSTLKPNIVTNDISLFNKITIKQIESKAKEEDGKKYSHFPEYIGKDY